MKINEGNRRRVTDPRESLRRGRAMNGHRNVLQIEFHFRPPPPPPSNSYQSIGATRVAIQSAEGWSIIKSTRPA